MTPTNTGTTVGRDLQCPLQRLPPELRNTIFQRVLIQETAINIKKGSWPALLVTCTQFRSEAPPVDLSNNNFVVHIRNLDETPLTGWLALLKGLRINVQCIPILTVRTGGDVLHVSREPCTVNPQDEVIKLQPPMDFWSALVTRLKDARLEARQLIWPGLDHAALVDLSPAEYHLHYLQHLWLNKGVLQPLLKFHGILDANRPPVDVRSQMRGDRRISTRIYRSLADGGALRRDYGRHGPEDWFEVWCKAQTAVEGGSGGVE